MATKKTRDIDSAFLARLVVDQDRTFHTLLTDDLQHWSRDSRVLQC